MIYGIINPDGIMQPLTVPASPQWGYLEREMGIKILTHVFQQKSSVCDTFFSNYFAGKCVLFYQGRWGKLQDSSNIQKNEI